jgi:hypothetical protein
MAAALTTITNLSKQTVPILINEIALDKANSASGVPPAQASQMHIAPGAQVTIETKRVDVGQLEQLRRKNLLSFTTQ